MAKRKEKPRNKAFYAQPKRKSQARTTTPIRMHVLRLMAADPGITLPEIAKAVGLTVQRCWQIQQLLTRDGKLERVRLNARRCRYRVTQPKE